MADADTHKMIMTGEADGDGYELWECPLCPQRRLIHWPPDWREVMLDRGDATVKHAAVKDIPGVRLHVGAQKTLALSAADQGWLGSAGVKWEGPAGGEQS